MVALRQAGSIKKPAMLFYYMLKRRFDFGVVMLASGEVCGET